MRMMHVLIAKQYLKNFNSGNFSFSLRDVLCHRPGTKKLSNSIYTQKHESRYHYPRSREFFSQPQSKSGVMILWKSLVRPLEADRFSLWKV
jgi:hypothetical protein